MGTFEVITTIMAAVKRRFSQQLFTGGFVIKSRPFRSGLTKMVGKKYLYYKKEMRANFFIRQRLFGQ
jgi:hypothetical protein